MQALHLGYYLCPFLTTVGLPLPHQSPGLFRDPSGSPLIPHGTGEVLGSRGQGSLKVLRKRDTLVSEGRGKSWVSGVVPLFPVNRPLCVLCYCLSQKPDAPSHSHLADGTAKSNKYPCVSLEVPVYFLVSVFLSHLPVNQWHSIVGPSSVTLICSML